MKDISEFFKDHRDSIYHREQLSVSKRCGCFYCYKIFHPDEITEWVDRGRTALCPYCEIDSVVYETPDRHITKKYLVEMHKVFFDM